MSEFHLNFIYLIYPILERKVKEKYLFSNILIFYIQNRIFVFEIKYLLFIFFTQSNKERMIYFIIIFLTHDINTNYL